MVIDNKLSIKLFLAQSISSNQKIILGILMYHADVETEVCKISYSMISDLSNISKNTVINAVKDLEIKGFIKTIKCKNKIIEYIINNFDEAEEYASNLKKLKEEGKDSIALNKEEDKECENVCDSINKVGNIKIESKYVSNYETTDIDDNLNTLQSNIMVINKDIDRNYNIDIENGLEYTKNLTAYKQHNINVFIKIKNTLIKIFRGVKLLFDRLKK